MDANELHRWLAEHEPQRSSDDTEPDEDTKPLGIQPRRPLVIRVPLMELGALNLPVEVWDTISKFDNPTVRIVIEEAE